jgi:hypothetical protein
MKIIQIAAVEHGDKNGTYGTLYALADDGSIWMMIDPWDEDRNKWTKLPQPDWQEPDKK